MVNWLTAGRKIKEEWANVVKALNTYTLDPKKETAQREVKIPLTSINMDVKSLYLLLSEFGRYVINPENPNFLTIISERDQVLKAYAEEAKDGVYQRLEKIAFDPKINLLKTWVEKREALKDSALRQTGIQIGVIKEAQCKFFEYFSEIHKDHVVSVLDLFTKGSKCVREDLIQLYPDLPIKYLFDLLKRVDISTKNLLYLFTEVVPTARYGLVLRCENEYIGIIIEKDNQANRIWFPRSEVDEINLHKMDLDEFARIFRRRFGLVYTLGIRLQAVKSLLVKEMALSQFFKGYGTNYVISSQWEIGDLIDNWWELERLIFNGKISQKYTSNFEFLVKLTGVYAKNGVEYLQRNGVILSFVNGEDNRISYLINKKGVKEHFISKERGIKELKINVSFLRHTLDWWWVRPRLTRAIDYLSDAIPRAVLKNVSYETGLVVLNLRDDKQGHLNLYIIGGPHHFLNSAWLGDSFVILVDPSNKAIMFAEELPNLPVQYYQERSHIELMLPMASNAKLGSLGFDIKAKLGNRQGLTKFFSETSPLSGIVPGLYTNTLLAKLNSPQEIVIGKQQYRIESGWLNLEVSQGRMLQPPFGIRWAYNSWISGNGHGVQTGAITVGDSLVGEKSIKWWGNLIRETVNGGVSINYKDGEALIKRYDRAHCDIPLIYQGERVNIKGDAYIEDEGKTKPTRYQLTHATAVPFDENGNYLIRAKGMVAIDGKKGFGLVEIHCNLQNNIYRGQFEGDRCLILQIKEEKGALVFSYNGKSILVVDINGSKYLRHLRKIGIRGFSRGLFRNFLPSHRFGRRMTTGQHAA